MPAKAAHYAAKLATSPTATVSRQQGDRHHFSRYSDVMSMLGALVIIPDHQIGFFIKDVGDTGPFRMSFPALLPASVRPHLVSTVRQEVYQHHLPVHLTQCVCQGMLSLQ